MIIHPPFRSRVGNEIQISCRVEFDRGHRSPSELWFRFSTPPGSEPSLDIDPFVVALLLVAMQEGEPIHAMGTLSRRLVNGLQAYQTQYHSWFPDRFKTVSIEPIALRDDTPLLQSGVACAFSGGVDSFYTLLSLLGRANETAPEQSLSHTLFMAGFDMPLNLKQSIGELTSSYSQMMKDLGLTFISGSTNVRTFVNSVDWTNSHGQALGASALFFKNQWREFFVPSSYTLGYSPRWGTHPSLDPLLSTEALTFSHHGTALNRLNKLEAISKAPESYPRLRVCWIQDIGLRNCGKCEKCIRTMVALEILKARNLYSTFPQNSFDRRMIRTLSLRTLQSRIFARELNREALKRGRLKIALDLEISLLRREIFYRTKSLSRFFR